MKSLYIAQALLAIGLGSSLLSSCNKDFLELQPTSHIAAEQATSSIKNLEALKNGLHSYLYMYYYNQGYTGEPNINIVRDMMGEDLLNSDSGPGWFIDEANWIAHRNIQSYTVYSIWSFYYNIIVNTNSLLEAGPKIRNKENQSKVDYYMGQAYGLRAWSYFQLVQLFAKRYDATGANDSPGVVLRLKALDKSKLKRSTVAETYKQIEQDLEQAVLLLSNSGEEFFVKNELNLPATIALRARVALTKQDWANAEKYATQAITAAENSRISFSTKDDLLSGMNSLSNPEWIWGSTQANSQNKYYGSFFAFLSWNFNSTAIRSNPKLINKNLYESMSETDIRRAWWDPTGAKYVKTKDANFTSLPYENHKFMSKTAASSFGDLTYMRLPELYLIKAEAQAHQHKDSEAQATLFTFLQHRDPAYTQSSKTGNELLTEILMHRRIELWGEGFRFTDLKRLNQPLDREHVSNLNRSLYTDPNLYYIKAGDTMWQFVIPKEEIDAYPEVQQNDL